MKTANGGGGVAAEHYEPMQMSDKLFNAIIIFAGALVILFVILPNLPLIPRVGNIVFGLSALAYGALGFWYTSKYAGTPVSDKNATTTHIAITVIPSLLLFASAMTVWLSS